MLIVMRLRCNASYNVASILQRRCWLATKVKSENDELRTKYGMHVKEVPYKATQHRRPPAG
jgi:hypothetical protein